MQWSAKTSRGMVRPDNEDSWSVQEFTGSWWLAMVADGIGGNEGGGMASSLAVNYCTDYVASHRERETPEELLVNALRYGNRKVFEAAAGQTGTPGMGTTLTVALVSEDDGSLFVGHVGDSRVYVISSGRIRQITDDHSVTGELVRNGAITEEDAMRHPARNVLTMALGTQESVAVSSYREELARGDVVILCTDGLTSLVSSREIVRQLEEKPRDEVAADLVGAANSLGGYDNVTAVLMWPDIPGSHGAGEGW